MRKATALALSLVCIAMTACKPHPDQAARGVLREQRMEKRGEGERHGGLRRECRADIEQFCASDQTGRDRRMCLQSHLDKLSADCKTAVQERMNHRGGGGRRNRDNGNQTNQNDDN